MKEEIILSVESESRGYKQRCAGEKEQGTDRGHGRDQQAWPSVASEKLPDTEPARKGGILPTRWESTLSSTVPFPRRGHPRCPRFPETAGPSDSDFLPRQGSWDEVMAGESLFFSC